jgi:hypothetical protein
MNINDLHEIRAAKAGTGHEYSGENNDQKRPGLHIDPLYGVVHGSAVGYSAQDRQFLATAGFALISLISALS